MPKTQARRTTTNQAVLMLQQLGKALCSNGFLTVVTAKERDGLAVRAKARVHMSGVSKRLNIVEEKER